MRLSVEPSLTSADYDFSHQIRVRFVETDGMNIVHHSNYLAYFEEARVAFLAHVGHPFTEWRDAGLESPVLESFVTYRQPLRFDDVATIHLSLANVTRTTFQIAYLITVDGQGNVQGSGQGSGPGNGNADEARDVTRPFATGVTVHGCIKAESGRPTRLPAWLVEMGS